MNIKNNISQSIHEWLLSGDPSIQYQVYMDLMNVEIDLINETRKKIHSEGWGKRLLEFQDKEGTWAHGLYSPKWTSTFYTLLLLKRFEAQNHPKIERAINILLDKAFKYGPWFSFWKTWDKGEVCVTGMFLSILSHFEIDIPLLPKIAEYLVDHQMKDGGWNCEIFRGAHHSSFHTTLSVLEGLRDYAKFSQTGDSFIKKVQKEGLELLLQHKLFRSDTNMRIIDEKMLRFSFPTRWRYDIMKALDYAQSINATKDNRFSEAIEILKKKQNPDGTWNLQNKHAGKIFFTLETVGKPSRWNTLRGLRILKWWDK